jgi:hypothetical protein
VQKQLSIVEVNARGKVFREEKKFTELHELTEEELFVKYRHNAARILTPDKIEKSIEVLMKLDEIKHIKELTANITA